MSLPMRPIAIAPATHGKPPSPPSVEATMPYACVSCTRRKVKCDKLSPSCSACRKGRTECVYQEPAPRKRKRKPQDDLLDRLDYYEKLLKQNGITTAESSDPSPAMESMSQSPTTDLDSRDNQQNRSATLQTDGIKARYINSSIWRNLNEEYLHPSDEEEDEEEEEVEEAGNRRAGYPGGDSFCFDPVSFALLGTGAPIPSLINFHPSYETALKLWEVYVRNVDPVTRVVHVPSTQDLLQRSAADPSGMPKATEALLFSIYHFAVESMTDEECQETFQTPRASLKARYHDALRQALVSVQFLKTTDIVVVRAYALFLLSVRNTYDPHTFWILTGVAARLGQRLGLHRSGVNEQSLKPFDVEMRRRLWWQLLPLDGIASQFSGTGIAVPSDSWDTEPPSNVNDVDISPDMVKPPEPSEGATDMIFCLTRCEIGRYLQKNSSKSSDWARDWSSEDIAEHELRLKEIEKLMETKYLRYCDICEPIHCLTMLLARTAACSGKFRMRLPHAKRAFLTNDYRKEQWSLAQRCLDCDAACHNNPLLHRYRWHTQAIFQWDPLIWILCELRRDPSTFDGDSVWSKIETAFRHHSEILTVKRALHVAVGRLAVKAWDACQALRLEASYPPKRDPSFIEHFRSTLNRRRQGQNKRSREDTESPYLPFHPVPQDTGSYDPATKALQTVSPEATPLESADLGDFQMDTSDWMIWDQFLHDPETFTIT